VSSLAEVKQQAVSSQCWFWIRMSMNFPADFWQTKIRLRIQLSARLWV